MITITTGQDILAPLHSGYVFKMERRETPKQKFIGKLGNELEKNNYSIEVLEKVCRIVRLDVRADELLEKINERRV